MPFSTWNHRVSYRGYEYQRMVDGWVCVRCDVRILETALDLHLSAFRLGIDALKRLSLVFLALSLPGVMVLFFVPLPYAVGAIVWAVVARIAAAAILNRWLAAQRRPCSACGENMVLRARLRFLTFHQRPAPLHIDGWHCYRCRGD